ncbi:pyridoxamine 5'-phosphate oxidase family protein [Polaribacter sp. Hel1_85]|uniref:pyridoxamine 5'-phosphate oxidase family protein n=1 Tax=Polaribacter sp. Hel1_85 TaxID=1250005 RepID=UPI00052D21CB|nr:pyridoxamine 5'-phosphate oxidase family protein [Polaribacter sp. Hel1_85]KGL64183.1 pyridoxamine 5'-phosphate oxidase-like FMN-binding protein [Polaribacter sp. Hel1_85]
MKSILFSLFLIVLVSCKKDSEPLKTDLKEIAKEIMVNAKNCALITVDAKGIAHARAMDPFLPEEDFTVWMGTNSKSLKVSQIQQNENVTLYYFDKENASYVTLQGVASIVNTKKEKEQFWKKEWENFYKNKATDYLLIKFTPNSANVISEKHSILGESITWKTPQINFRKK